MAEASTEAAAGASTAQQQSGNFGDVLNALMMSLPSEASMSFLRCLTGLTAEESNMLSSYLIELKEEKKFRVIQTLMDAPVPAKKRFLASLHEKFERLKQQGGGSTGDPRAGLQRANSRQSSMKNVTTEDIRNMGNMLDNAHIGESELRLRRLEEDSREDFAGVDHDLLKADLMINKRERPNSNWELLKGEAAPAQKTKEEAGSSDDDDEDEDDEIDAENSPDGGEHGTEISQEDAPSTKRWTKAQDTALKESVRVHGEKNWKAIAERVPGRNHAQCLQRWRKVLKPGLVKGHWSFEEDKILEVLVKQSCNNWGQIAEQIPGRTPKQCRERWRNHLDPSINKGPYAEDEDQLILGQQARLGNKWSQIAQMLPGRTEDSVKIRWKSLKQNPTRAAAANAQNRRLNNMQHQPHMGTTTNMGMPQPQPHLNQPNHAAMMNNWAADYSDFSGSHTAMLNASYMPYQQQQHIQSNEMQQMLQGHGAMKHEANMYTAHYPPPMHQHPPPQAALGHNYDEFLMKSLTDELDFDEFGLI
ncbi:Aste57867_2519 [Aphanomyces stellatus]|uniref:Aste57867_2519 protein n=1 Tax=Aphanomyces stellatus TaxID=120398 RepID=A0A485KBH0_9STRA|nr:hypothetical protein As57867_002512 [Aphanomyces stellatus]VFT79718.1 Aste57867_2519 [Aphanomyces stellatus]